MMTLTDGPAEGFYAVPRAPHFLRAVVDQDGGKDVLDQLDDQPEPGETIHVYRCTNRQDDAVTMVMMSGKNGRGRRCVPSVVAEYQHMPDIDGDAMRNTAAWRAWAAENAPETSIDPSTG